MNKSPHLRPILVLDGDKSSALAVVRSLGRRGLRVEVGSSKTQPIAALSKYCSGHFIYPDPLVDVSGFREAVRERLRRCSYSLIIPVTDLTICPLMKIRESIEELSSLAMASNAALSLALSKSRTCDLARTLGVPIPKTVVVKDVEELETVQERLTYPAVIKADRSKTWSANGKGQENPVAYVVNAQELHEAAVRFLPLGPVVHQEYVPGEAVGMGVIASHGEIVFAFQYRSLHEVPLTGGTSSYRISDAIDPKLFEYTSLLLKSLCWDGVGMTEFKIDGRTGTYFMEINGRFWASLPLAVAAGADFPSYLFDLMVRRRRWFPNSYKVGLRCRQLSGEFEWMKEVLFERTQANRIVRVPSYRGILIDSCRLLNPAEFTDTLDLRDPWPGIKDIWSILREIKKSGWRKLWRVITKRRMRRIQQNPKFLVDKLLRSRTVLLVCSGNVIRSPFAARLLAQVVENKRPISIFSAGLNAIPGQQARPSAISKGKSLGLDLSSHVSAPLTADMVAKADIIFAMEIEHLFLMRQRFPGSRGKTFLLGCLSPEVLLEIPDPDFKDEATFEACFDQIIRSLQPVARMPATMIQCCEA